MALWFRDTEAGGGWQILLRFGKPAKKLAECAAAYLCGGKDFKPFRYLLKSMYTRKIAPFKKGGSARYES